MFLVAKAHLRRVSAQLRVGSFVYALQQPKLPAIQFRDLDRVKWEMDTDYEDKTDERGFVTLREGDTIVDGRMWSKGKWLEPPIHLEIQWAFKYDPNQNDYQWRAIFRPESSHVVVNDKGRPLQQISTGDWLILQKAFGKSPFVSPVDEMKKLQQNVAGVLRTASPLTVEQEETAKAFIEDALDVSFKDVAWELGFDGRAEDIWGALDRAGLREEFQSFVARYVREVITPWYNELTSTRLPVPRP
jgi:hypothetical protein